MSIENSSTSDQHRILFPTIIPNDVRKLLKTTESIQKQTFRKYIKGSYKENE